MASTISIGSNSRALSEVDPSWVAQQIRDRRADGRPVCVRLQLDEPDARMSLAAGVCPPAGGGGSRRPNALEAAIFELWGERGLNDGDVKPGELIAFLAQLGRLTG